MDLPTAAPVPEVWWATMMQRDPCTAGTCTHGDIILHCDEALAEYDAEQREREAIIAARLREWHKSSPAVEVNA